MRTRQDLARIITVVVVLVVTAVGVAPNAWAEPEPNDTLAAATPTSVGVSGIPDATIHASGDVDFYRFEASQAGTYTIDVYDVAAAMGAMCVIPYR
ncbi:hypothetical protein, partial [Knoellia alttitudinis]